MKAIFVTRPSLEDLALVVQNCASDRRKHTDIIQCGEAICLNPQEVRDLRKALQVREAELVARGLLEKEAEP